METPSLSVTLTNAEGPTLIERLAPQASSPGNASSAPDLRQIERATHPGAFPSATRKAPVPTKWTVDFGVDRQQIRNKSVLADTGNTVTRELVEKILGEETERLRTEFGDEAFRLYYQPASKLIGEICLSEDYTDFLTTPAYELVG